MSPLGLYIKKQRKLRGWTLSELSRQSNVPYGTLRNIEQNPNAVKPKEITITRIGAALEEKNMDLLFAAAGYGIPISPSEEARRDAITMLLLTNPEWGRALERVQNEMTAEEQDQALHMFRMFIQLRPQ